MCNVTINEEKNGIEIRFENKPEAEVLEALKENGFRWSGKQKMWYAKQSEERIAFVKSIGEVSAKDNAEKDETDDVYDLFEMTRVDLIGDNVDKSLSVKEIAALVRTHMKKRFPMCKVSVRTRNYDCIDIEIVQSPFEKGSDELNAIADYFEKYTESYNYCTCYDPYGDYGSSYNFYGAHSPVGYMYTQSEKTVHHIGMAERFQQSKAAFEEEQKRREQEDFERRMKEDEERRKQSEIADAIRRKNFEKVDAAAIVVKLSESEQYFLENCIDPCTRKRDAVEEYEERITDNAEKELTRYTCKVFREVIMTQEEYDIFSRQLMDDWSFVAGTGGSRTDDVRINSMMDYNSMDEEERKTVDWYSYDCVAVYCGVKLMMVVDAQGHSYCRYVYLVDKKTEKTSTHHTDQAWTEEERETYLSAADTLYDVSTETIVDNGWIGEGNWNVKHFPIYKAVMIGWIKKHNIPFNINVVRAIPEDYGAEFKSAMYRVLNEVDGIQYQFTNADLKQGQRITIIRIGEFGGISLTRATFDSFECGKYAQYDHAVKLIVRPERKRDMRYIWLYKEVLIYDGWLDDIPDSLLFDINETPTVITKRSKFDSFDHGQYDVVMDYLKSKGAKLLVNTYKPVFNG